MTFFFRLFLLIFIYNSSVFASVNTILDASYDIYKAQSLIPPKEVPQYERGTFHTKAANSFDLDTDYLAFPATTGRRDLFKRLLRNDVMLMFYLSKNNGMSNTDKLVVRLQAFDIVYGFFLDLQEENEEDTLPPMTPLFKFAGGNYMRLHTLMWIAESGHPRAISKAGRTIILKGDIMLCEKITTGRELLKYARFMSIKERRSLNRR